MKIRITLLKDYLFLIGLYVVPFLCYIILFCLFITGIISVFLIPYVIYEQGLSSRAKSPIIIFLLVNVIAQFHIIRTYKKSLLDSEKNKVLTENETPIIFKNLINELKTKLSITKKVLISVEDDEFLAYEKKQNLVINIPLIGLLLLEPKHLKVIIEHELLHFLHWDTSFNNLSEKSIILITKVKSHLELKSVSLLNPTYWILRIILFFQKKVFLVRQNISEKMINKKLESDVYNFAVLKVAIAEHIAFKLYLDNLISKGIESELDSLIEIFKRSYVEDFLKNPTELMSSKQGDFDFNMDWNKVCYANLEIQQVYQAQEIDFLSKLFHASEELNFEEEIIEHPKETQKILNLAIIQRVQNFFTALELPTLEFEMVTLDRTVVLISETINVEKNERFIVLKIPKKRIDKTKTIQEIIAFGKDSKEKYPYYLNSYCLFILEDFDEMDVEEIAESSYKELPSVFYYIFSRMLSYIPIPLNIKCGGIIPVFISEKTEKFYYKIPTWSFYRRFVMFGFQSIWNDSIATTEVEDKQEGLPYDNVIENPRLYKWLLFLLFLVILGANILVLYDEDNLNYNNLILIIGIGFFISGFALLFLHYPILVNNLHRLFAYGTTSVITFDSHEERELFILFEKRKAIIKKQTCLVLIGIGIILMIYNILLE